MLSLVTDRPRWIVCEDGAEYVERFVRFLGEEFDFVSAGCAERLFALSTCGAEGVILDLDFRRTPAEQLVDETGATRADLPGDARSRLSETQGILILRQLRAIGSALPVLLFADLDDEAQRDWLARTYAPVAIIPSHESLVTTAARMRRG